jgi:hypothetical protein
LDASFKAYDEFKEDQDKWYVSILAPAQDKLYDAIKTKLDKLFEGNDDASLHGKKKEIQQAVVEGLKEYFKQVQPSLIKAMEDMKITEDEEYDFLTDQYDEHSGYTNKKVLPNELKGIESIKALVEYSKDKKAKLAHLKKGLYHQKPLAAGGAQRMLIHRHLSHHFAKYNPVEIGAYLKPKIEKEGYEIKDKMGFLSADLGEHLALREGVINKEGHKYVGKKEKEEEEK